MDSKIVTDIDDWSRELRSRITVETPRDLRGERYESSHVLASAASCISQLEKDNADLLFSLEGFIEGKHQLECERELLFEELEKLTYSFDGRAKMRELK